VDSDELRRLLRLQQDGAGKRIPARHYRTLLSALLQAVEVSLDGDPLGISKVPLQRVAVVDRVGSGYRITLRNPDEVDVQFEGDPTLVLAGGILRPRGDGRLTELQLHQLRAPLLFHPHELPRLTAEWLPSLERAVQVIRRDGIPQEQVGGLDVLLELQPRAGLLEASARIVYGDPPVAELRGEELIPLGGVRALPPRDKKGELQAISQLREQLAMRPGQRLRLEDADAARFVRDRLAHFSGTIVGEEYSRRFEVAAQPLQPQVEWQDGRVAMSFRSGAGEASAERVLDAWHRGESLVPLQGGGFATLPQGWLEEHSHLLDTLASAGKGGGAGRHLATVAAEIFQSLQEQLPEGLRRLADVLREEGEVPQLDPPPGLRATLRPYQLRGWSWLQFLGEQEMGAVLADDMGLGKTVQALASLEAERGSGPSLVVAPTSVLRNWQSEAQRFTPDLRVIILHGGDRSARLQELRTGEADLAITSYAILRRDIDELAGLPFRTVVLDEAQAIKNPDSQTARAARRLQAQRRIALTGTPLENRVSELWSLMEFLNPGFFGSRQRFEERLAGPAAQGDKRAVELIRRRIAPFVLRRLKEEVAPDLPPRTETVLHCPLSEDQQRHYEAVRQAAITGLRQPPDPTQGGGRMGNRRMQVLTALTRLRQAACHPALLPGGPPDADSAKLDRLLELLPPLIESGHKALVFSQWTSLLDLVEPRLLRAGIPFLRLDGSTRDRSTVVEHFQSSGGPPIFLISLKAGGTGLNLTAADHVFHLDPWWNPAVERQATDRAHRIGQTRPVFAWKLVSEGTVEERILALQQRKQGLADAVLSGTGSGSAVALEELEELLRPLPA
jgi:superfamily II DNA or RNA helicase